MSETYQPGELFVYTNGDRWELGQVKRPNNTGDGYFCWYSTGDTAANTPVECMHKLANAGWSHVEATTLDMKVRDVSADDVLFECSWCHCKVYNIEKADGDCGSGIQFCLECGGEIV